LQMILRSSHTQRSKRQMRPDNKRRLPMSLVRKKTRKRLSSKKSLNKKAMMMRNKKTTMRRMERMKSPTTPSRKRFTLSHCQHLGSYLMAVHLANHLNTRAPALILLLRSRRTLTQRPPQRSWR